MTFAVPVVKYRPCKATQSAANAVFFDIFEM